MFLARYPISLDDFSPCWIPLCHQPHAPSCFSRRKRSSWDCHPEKAKGGGKSSKLPSPVMENYKPWENHRQQWGGFHGHGGYSGTLTQW